MGDVNALLDGVPITENEATLESGVDEEAALEEAALEEDDGEIIQGDIHDDLFGNEYSVQDPTVANFATPNYPESDAVPQTGVQAEVVILCTSLGAARKSFFGSKRATQLLDCKGHPYFAIDSNKDVGQDRLDQELIAQWTQQELLHADPNNVQNPYLVPQVIIDGISIGEFQALQDLCEDGDLDWILVRAECPNCLGGRNPDDSQCGHCGVYFQELIPAEAVEQKLVVQWLRGVPVNGAQKMYSVDFAEHDGSSYAIDF